jgi:small conductance mechanosensitive channel
MDFFTTDLRALLIGLAGSAAHRGRWCWSGRGYFGARPHPIDHLERPRGGRATGALPGDPLAVTTSQRAGDPGVVGLVRVVICLSQLGYDATHPAGAGIAPAVGFGAQHLVRDVIAGFFLVLEDQVRVGDVAVVNGTGGLVETVTFRTIVLRDLAGTVHIFPNGSVTTLANMTKDWSGYVVDVEVGYREDPDRIVALMRRVFEELRQDPAHGPLIIEPIEIFGVDAFRDSTVVIKARLKTVPIQQWTVGREYRRRLLLAFGAEGVEVPASRVIHIGDAGKPFSVLMTQGAAPLPR